MLSLPTCTCPACTCPAPSPKTSNADRYQTKRSPLYVNIFMQIHMPVQKFMHRCACVCVCVYISAHVKSQLQKKGLTHNP